MDFSYLILGLLRLLTPRSSVEAPGATPVSPVSPATPVEGIALPLLRVVELQSGVVVTVMWSSAV